MKLYIKIKKTKWIIKFGDIKIENQKLRQYKKPNSIKNKDIINKILVSNKVFLGKNGFKYFMAREMLEQLDLYVYFSQNNSNEKCFQYKNVKESIRHLLSVFFLEKIKELFPRCFVFVSFSGLELESALGSLR